MMNGGYIMIYLERNAKQLKIAKRAQNGAINVGHDLWSPSPSNSNVA